MLHSVVVLLKRDACWLVHSQGICSSNNFCNRVGALCHNSLAEWSKIGHGTTFLSAMKSPWIVASSQLCTDRQFVVGADIQLLIIVRNGKPKSQDNQHCHCSNSTAVLSMNLLRWRKHPFFPLLFCTFPLVQQVKPCSLSETRQIELVQIYGYILHPMKELSQR